MTGITWMALVLGGFVAALMVLATFGRQRWTEATQALLGQLEAARLSAPRLPYNAREIEGLPAPVQRYFRAVLKDGQRMVTGVTVRHTGTFNVTGLGSRATWMPFTSEQRVLTRRPGFVWNARMTLVPGIAIYVHDAYVAGVGTLHPAVMGLFSLTHQHGSGDIARGELMRYMMEAVWYPTALLPSQGTTWVAVDAVSADATMVDGDISMTMRFTFDAAGLIETVAAAARGALVGGKVVMMPWEGRLSNYQERAGMRVPLTGEAAWLAPGGRKPYFRGSIVSAAYEFSR
ncbi:MAG: hypothetical protein B7Y41_00440 [Hydrogenophilales bacterium 28-61-23]|nr:MAG: hypothetical protein B7Y41_00440 [Hydrogenophilales bacterium 28-61-23]